MYSLLQSLTLVPSNAIPSLGLLIPFGEESLIRIPPLPTDSSVSSVGGFLAHLLASPGVLTFLYAFYLRPEVEERIYRLVRRQLPKPTVVDEHSIRVAYEENLIDWVVPTLGRRSTEEMRRAKLTLLEDIKDELAAFRGWVFSLFCLLSTRKPDPEAVEGADHERIETLRNSIESLQHEIEEVQFRNNAIGNEPEGPPTRPLGSLTRTNTVDIAQPDLPAVAEPAQLNDTELALGMTQVLTNENRMSQSPGEMSSDYYSEMATLGRSSAHSTTTNTQSQPSHTQAEENATRDRQNSRSNTLFSRPSSPETSPPTSPRVRASLIHQSSDIITMQLELLDNRNRNRNTQNRIPSSNLLPRLSGDLAGLHPPSTAVDRRSIADFLEALILSQAQHQATQQSVQAETDGLSTITAGASFTTAQEVPAESEPQNLVQEAMAAEHPSFNNIEGPPSLTVPNILPDGLEEPSDENPGILPPHAVGATQSADIQTDSLANLPTSTSRVPEQRPTNQPTIAHRVTLLSAHPVDSLASHLAAVISTIILAPLESLCLRSLAYSYLSAHPSPVARLSDLHPMDLWFGGHSWSDGIAYTGRLVLMRGMQAALRAGVWGFLVGSTMRIGRKFCGWGTL